MADNSTLPATGDTIAADDIGGVKFQRVKIIQGIDGVNDGDVSATNPLNVAGTFWQAKQPVSILSTDISGNIPVTFSNSAISITGSTIANTSFGVSSLGSIPVSGESLPVNQIGSASTSVNTISTSTTAATITSNSSRKATVIYNDSSAILYLLFGSGTASPTNFTTKLNPNATLQTQSLYTGNISGILASGTGTARVTEFS